MRSRLLECGDYIVVMCLCIVSCPVMSAGQVEARRTKLAVSSKHVNSVCLCTRPVRPQSPVIQLDVSTGALQVVNSDSGWL